MNAKITPVAPSLDSLIRNSVKAAQEAGREYTADEIVTDVLSAIDPFTYEKYVREAIRFRISTVVGDLRSAATPAIRKGVSTKQTLIRDQYWPAFLRQQVALPSGYKSLAQCTAEDLRFVADVRRSQANELLTRANQFSTLADLMDTAKVRFLEQLDSSQGERTLQAA